MGIGWGPRCNPMDSPSAPMPSRLTARQRRFVEEYCVIRRREGAGSETMLNGTQAAIAAGYSKKTARQMAHENLTKPYIQKEIEARQKGLREAATLQGLDVLERLSDVARMDMKENPTFRREILGALIVLAKVYGLFDRKERALERPEDAPPTIWFDFTGATPKELHDSPAMRELAKITGQTLPPLSPRAQEVRILPPKRSEAPKG